MHILIQWLRLGTRLCISNKFQDDVGCSAPGTTLEMRGIIWAQPYHQRLVPSKAVYLLVKTGVYT